MEASCTVPGCDGQNSVGWRPLCEPLSSGRKVCEYHFNRHKDKQDEFSLFEAFGFERPVEAPKPVPKKGVVLRACGREREPARRLCEACAAERERKRKKQYYDNRKSRVAEPVVEETTPRCKLCDNARSPGHSYCQKCAERRETTTRRKAQSRYWKKQHIHRGLD